MDKTEIQFSGVSFFAYYLQFFTYVCARSIPNNKYERVILPSGSHFYIKGAFVLKSTQLAVT